jgi:hypothetical protein
MDLDQSLFGESLLGPKKNDKIEKKDKIYRLKNPSLKKSAVYFSS